MILTNHRRCRRHHHHTVCDGLLIAHHTIRSENTHQFSFINCLELCVDSDWVRSISNATRFGINCCTHRKGMKTQHTNWTPQKKLKLYQFQQTIFFVCSVVLPSISNWWDISLAGESVNCVHATISSFISFINWFRVDWIALDYQLMVRMDLTRSWLGCKFTVGFECNVKRLMILSVKWNILCSNIGRLGVYIVYIWLFQWLHNTKRFKISAGISSMFVVFLL